MEGPGEVDFKDGWMHIRSPDETMHHVFWCPERFPESFIAQWDAQNLKTDAGLCIVFFAAAALDGQSVLAERLPERDGTFSQYTKGAIRCYHVSYYANTPDVPDRGHANLRKNPGFHLVQEGQEGIPAKSERVHTITLAKIGPVIRLWVDGRLVIDWIDTGQIGGDPHGDGYLGFRQMQWTHFRYRNLRVWEPADGESNDERVGLESIERRKQILLAKAAERPLNLKVANPKLQNPFILARLAVGAADPESLGYLARGARFHARASWFGMCSLAQILAAYESQLPAEVLDEIRVQVTRYPHFLGGGTENHRVMNRAAGLIFGERWPDDTFHHGISGRELVAICKQYVRDYGREIYATSMTEYLSPVYHAVNTAPWMMLAQHSRDEETRLMARAIADWMFADLALNCHHSAIVPPLTRCKAQLHGQPGHDRLSLAPTLATAWLYWGTEVADADVRVDSSSVPHHAQSSYVPPSAIRNLGAKRVEFPFTVRQSRPSRKVFERLTENAHGYQARNDPEFGPLEPRFHLRSVYFDRDYAVGAGYFQENIHNPDYRESIPFGAVWRSANPYARLVVGHPYWFVNYQPKSWPSPSPEDMWSGMSPFQQVVHAQNAAILLFDIPDANPYRDVKLRWGPDFARVDPPHRPLQSCFAYYPESVDQQVRTDTAFFLRDGDVYIAIRPLRGEAAWSECAVPGYGRIDMPGAVTGCVVELGSRSEFGSFESFQQRVDDAALDCSALITEKRVRYESTRGIQLEIQFNDQGWLPLASVDGQPLDFDGWPVCESPYVTSRDRVLDVHDGVQGLTIDWRGDLPIYSYYNVPPVKRR